MPIFLQPRAEVEMVYASGALRLTVDHQFPMAVLLLEAIGVAGALFWGGWRWERELLSKSGGQLLVAALVVINVIILAYHITGSEAIEFNDRQLVISRTNLGWQRTSGYPLEKCSRLHWVKPWGKPGSFKCKVGWTRISFAHYLSDEQAQRLLGQLQMTLPNVAARLLGIVPPPPPPAFHAAEK
ncbi:MAG TPA: hypothetical protein VKW06_18770 [Candidatus Angelobacter sp.]|nr:hypothetical protein [Candidatus Angelobacter sp.]